jgi:electron transfer flavoprotein beta subunit
MAAGQLDIVVLLREVRDPRPPVRIATGAVTVRHTGLRTVVNPADLSALEVAVGIAEQRDGVVTALAVGDEGLDDSLRLALSMGAVRAVRVWDDAMKDADAVAEARVLRRVMETLGPDLFLTGSRLLDRGDDPSAALAAATVGMPCVGSALSLRVERGVADVVRKAEKGARQHLVLTLPCAVLLDASAAEPRYPELPAVLRSLEAPVELWGIEDLALPAWELGFDGAVLRPAGVSFPRSDPLRVPTPDPSLPGHERVRALFSGGIRPRAARMHFGSADEAVGRILEIFLEERLVSGDPR